jgi:quinol monooxygenase YgiN
MVEPPAVNTNTAGDTVIHVLAIINTKPGMRDTVLNHFRANVPAVLAEDGCIEYGAAIDAAPAPAFQSPCGPDTFVVIEKWASLQALQAHAAAPHMASYAAKTREHIASRTLHILSPT